MALAMEISPPAFAMGVGMPTQQQQQQEEEPMIDEDQEGELGQQEDQFLEPSLFGPVHRQKRRQEIPRARRRCFPSFVADGSSTLSGDLCSDVHDTMQCSFRTIDEPAICSTVLQSSESQSRRDFTEMPCQRSPTDSTIASDDGDSSLSCASWSAGQLVWAKFSRSPWWPAQVADEKSMSERTRQSKNHVLVRFFGNYNYGWVDPASDLSKFDVDFDGRSQVPTKAFQKGLKEALEYRDFRKLPLKWRHSFQEECQTPHANGKESSEETGSEARNTATRRRKPKVLYEEEERLHQKPKRNLRRKKIMRELGLCAPYGSPFTYNSIGTSF
ncbi:hypothetical protein SELMODRAFT_437524 [Selaginella moellendorffii]|uniref:PWWP domain-containing protein n=1 Tax=Selaginella moellendorffii TaxID=88036 RepID=D8QMR8_SELML|nr:uncharacterized protein LOC9632242 [Selaginella moellendorffii]XP_024525182.1 uncharacterized protein LOC9632242 [Selaginella moellendorffii]EFJ38630.1 hypothetical protein SELMODRAFT_437524 [Selaginella moellendorffii]|eukprot:XP_002961091.1 uncharacterized protein LOC9632242 [Selaginella moellendorffii]